MDDTLIYQDMSVLGEAVFRRIPVKVTPRLCPGCEGQGWVAWFVRREWPTPHELPIDRAANLHDDMQCGKARPCRYCDGIGLWGGDVQRIIADEFARYMDQAAMKAIMP